MKNAFGWLLAGFLATTSVTAATKTYYALEVRGGSRVFSLDAPVRKGRVMLFHRYPDGVYSSLPASEVETVSTLDVQPPPAEKLAPGETLYVGNAVQGPSYELPPASQPPDGYAYPDSYDYGYSGYSWGGGGGYVPPRPPGPLPPSRIGPERVPDPRASGNPGVRSAADRAERIPDPRTASAGFEPAQAVAARSALRVNRVFLYSPPTALTCFRGIHEYTIDPYGRINAFTTDNASMSASASFAFASGYSRVTSSFHRNRASCLPIIARARWRCENS